MIETRDDQRAATPAAWWPARAAAVVHADGEHVEALLAAVCEHLRSTGVRVGGLCQRNRPAPGGRRPLMELVDVETGDVFSISRDLGAGSQSCCIDPAGIAAASVALRRALDREPDLLVVNRFGAIEKERQGFASEMLDAMASGIPLLTAVHDRYAGDWITFAEDAGTVLAPEHESVTRWVSAILETAGGSRLRSQRAKEPAGGPGR